MQNNSRQHPIIRMLFDSHQRFRNQNLDIAGLQANISAVMSAIEGDVPKPIREAIFSLEAEVDSIRFTVSSSSQTSYVDEAFLKLEKLLEEFS